MRRKVRSYSGTADGSISPREIRNRDIARKAAAEGIVLLKNERESLPFQKGEKIALFGGGACNTIKGGTGSGDVNEREAVSVLQGMLNRGFEVIGQEWLEDYKKEYEEARTAWKNSILEETAAGNGSFFDIYSSHSFQVPSGRKIMDEDVSGAETNKAVYVVSRVAGEAADRYAKKGDYYLTDREYENLEYVCRHFEEVILVLNTGAQIDLSYVDELRNITGILYMSQAGMEGGNALADILCGDAVPCGKLTDTWAKDYHDYPAASAFSHNNGNVSQEYYQEGIYVGYRYFDSFGIKPRYGFGYGLSYTDFAINPDEDFLKTENQQVILHIAVKNVGECYSGKEVVQAYVSCPQKNMDKEFRRLCGFAKTEVLKPGEKQTLQISFPAKAMASYKETESAWMLEEGLYGIWIGNSLQEAVLSGAVKVERETVLERIPHICPLQEKEAKNLDEIVCPKDCALDFEQKWHRDLQDKRLPVAVLDVIEDTVSGVRPIKEEVLTKEEKSARELAAKLTPEELILMTIGEISKGQSEELNPASDNALGSAAIMVPGAAGETSSVLDEKYDVPGMVMADGPAGLRLAKSYEVANRTGAVYPLGLLDALEGGLFQEKKTHEDVTDYYQYCTAVPVGTLLAQTWDTALMDKIGKAIADEMEEFHITLWLAPGMNIHRDPLCGRNFEYYSEDPVVSGHMAAAITRGVQSHNGVGTTIKHFACNNQEDNRKGSDSILSERALREIYLRGFEIAVKEAQPMAIMTSYNLINGVHTANSYDLCTQAARNEWGFKGIIMTDWTTTAESGGSISHQCIKAGNDLIMPGSERDIEDMRQALLEGKLTEDELRSCVQRILSLVFQSNCYEEAVSYGRHLG